MLLTRAALEQIQSGRVTVVFRRWRRPTVKRGGRLRTAVGELAIEAVDVVAPEDITDDDAVHAGFDGRSALLAELFRVRPVQARGARPNDDSLVYRIRVQYVGGDARATLRADDALDPEQLADVVSRLDRLDARSSHGPWTRPMLQRIGAQPGQRAPELAAAEGRETLPFKADVRKLKELGLTESLTVGYRLSPRGQRVLAAIDPSTTLP